MNRKSFMQIALAGLMSVGAATAAMAEGYPSKPITLIVNFGAGGTTDLSARVLAEGLSEELGVPVTVENRAGGGGTTGIAAVTRAEPDGYTLGTITASPVTTLYYTQDMSFHPIDDLTFLSQYATVYHPISVQADSEFESLQDLIDFAKANPGELRYSTAGPLNQAHLAMEQLALAEGLQMTYVPYSEGGATLITALIGGHVDAAVASDFAAPLAAGQIKLLAETGETNIPQYSDVPTLRDLGYDFGSVALAGIIAPAGLDPEAKAALEPALEKVIQSDEFKAALTKLSMTHIYRNSDEFAGYAARALENTGKILEALQGN